MGPEEKSEARVRCPGFVWVRVRKAAPGITRRLRWRESQLRSTWGCSGEWCRRGRWRCAGEFQFQALADARSDGFRFLVCRGGARIQPDQNPLMSGLNFGEVHLPTDSMENGAACMAGGSEGNVGGARGMVDLAIGAADHDDVSGGLPAHLGLQMVLARGQNLAPNREGEGNLESKLVTGADRDGLGRRREGFWKDQNVFDCVFHRPSCEKRDFSGLVLNLVSCSCI
jgi:hypothetical protein